MKIKFSCAMLLLLPALTASVLAGDAAYVYPAKGQSAEQTGKDKKDCAAWAKQQTGFDPSQPTVVVSPPPKEGQVVRGGAGGAAVGAVGGAIAGDAGKGAAIGAASGALIGGVRKRRDAKEQKAQEQAAVNEARSAYDRAFKACLEGKGYTVK